VIGVPEKLLTTAQAAQLLGVNARTLLRYIERGVLQPTLTLPSGHHRWTEADIRAQLDALRQRDE
jgi:excisionase family DNA binding protein